MANTYTKNYQDNSALTEAQLDTALTSLQVGLDKTANLTTGATADYVLTASTPGSAATWESIPDPESPSKIRNIGLAASVGAGALTISLKTAAGTDPTSNDQVTVTFPDPDASSCEMTELDVASALSITVNASATLGITNTTTNIVFVYALKNSTANMALGVSKMGWLDQQGQGVTQISTSADSASIIYSSVASTATNQVRLLGYVTAAINSTGSWQTPAEVRLNTNVLLNTEANANKLIDTYTRTSGTASQSVRGVAISPSSSNFSTTSSTYVDVTNLSVTLSTSGRPIKIELISGATSSAGYLGAIRTAGGTAGADFQLLVDGSSIGSYALYMEGEVDASQHQIRVPCGSISMVSAQTAGTYTIKLQARGNTFSTAAVTGCKLVAYEL